MLTTSRKKSNKLLFLKKYCKKQTCLNYQKSTSTYISNSIKMIILVKKENFGKNHKIRKKNTMKKFMTTKKKLLYSKNSKAKKIM